MKTYGLGLEFLSPAMRDNEKARGLCWWVGDSLKNTCFSALSSAPFMFGPVWWCLAASSGCAILPKTKRMKANQWVLWRLLKLSSAGLQRGSTSMRVRKVTLLALYMRIIDFCLLLSKIQCTASKGCNQFDDVHFLEWTLKDWEVWGQSAALPQVVKAAVSHCGMALIFAPKPSRGLKELTSHYSTKTCLIRSFDHGTGVKSSCKNWFESSTLTASVPLHIWNSTVLSSRGTCRISKSTWHCQAGMEWIERCPTWHQTLGVLRPLVTINIHD